MVDLKNSSITKVINNFIEKHQIVTVFLAILIVGFTLSVDFFKSYPLHTTTDELGAIVGAATWAGYDWSVVINKSGYYGFGYYALFAPLFKLQLSPILIYRIILIVTRFLRSGVIISISYFIGKHYFEAVSNVRLILLSMICTIPLHPNNDANIINDVILDVLLWIIILTVCRIVEYIENIDKCIKWTIVYAVASFFSCFLHTRAIVMVIASFLTLMGVFLYKKKKVLFCTGVVIPLFLLAKIIIKRYQDAIWINADKGLGNTSVSVASGLKLTDIQTWKIWFDMIIGHISVQMILTGGLFILAIVVFVKYLYIVITKKETENIYVNIVLAISALCIVAVFSAFLVSNWFIKMYNTWNTDDKGNIYSYKAMCYVRYWNVFAMPFLYTGVYLTFKERYRDCIKKAIYIGSFFIVVFIEVVVPIVKTNSNAGSFLYTYLTYRGEKVTAQFYYKAILICVLFTVISILFSRKKMSREWAILPILILMFIGYHWANHNYNEYIKERVSSMVMSSYEEKCELEKKGVKLGRVYVYDDRKEDSNWNIYSVLQFYLYEYKIEVDYPKDVRNDDVIITYKRSEKLENDFPQLRCYQLDDNEVWYTYMDLSEEGM